MFDLLWLQEPQITTIADRGHHTDLDTPKKIGTEINVFATSQNIAMNLQHVDRPYAQNFFREKLSDRNQTSFTPTEPFLKAAKELKIEIPFKEINADTYADSVEKTLSHFFAREGQPQRKEQE